MGIGRPHTASSGSEAEFERLYRESFSEVYHFVLFRMLDEEAARDVTANAFLRAARYIDRFDPARAKFATWVKAIARNCIVDHYRTRKPTVPLEDALEARLSSPEDHAQRTIDRDFVIRLLAELDDDDREIIRLKYYDGLPNNEIARVLGMNASTVSTRVHRAIAKMRTVAERSL